MRAKALLAGCVLAFGCGGPVSESDIQTTAQGLSSEAPLHVQYMRGSKPGGGGNSGSLIDHGGKVLAADNTYAIWWGNPAAFPSDAQAGIDALFRGMNGSSFLGVSTQYMRGAASSSSFHTNLSDTVSSPPNHSPQVSAIVAEACSVLSSNGLTPDTNALYLVYTSNFPGHANYCAWHSHGTCNGVDIQVAYMPNTTGIAGCDPGNLYNCNSYSQGTRSLANVSSHEFMEAITDPDLNAWYDSGGSEIGDKCAWQFSSCVNLGSAGGNWQLQEEYSNSAGGCVQQ